jgi:MbtH protein
MSSNRFEDLGGRFYVVVNSGQQHSLWPSFADVPAGWRVIYGEESREMCLAYLAEHSTDLRPHSMPEARGAGPAAA